MAEFTIDELARRTGVGARNIRAWQTKRLLPSPRLQGRTGYYDEQHLQRVERIRDLRSAGVSLGSISSIVAGPAEASELSTVLGSLAASFAQEGPERLPLTQLLAAWPAEELTPEILARVEALRYLTLHDDGTATVDSPVLRAAGEQLAALGVRLADSLRLTEELEAATETIADAYAGLTRDHLEQIAGRGELGEQTLRTEIERMRPLAVPALLAAFQLAMSRKLAELAAEADDLRESQADGAR